MSPRFRDKFRHEFKYLLNLADYVQVRARVGTVLNLDRHARPLGHYTIRSLYFDDYYNHSYAEKFAGVQMRQKFRVRIYNYSDSVIQLERKIKVDSYILKQSAPLTRSEYDRLMAGDVLFLQYSSHELLRVFYYEYMSNIMRPRVIVDYDREPYVMEAGDVRVTFDKNVRAGMENFDIFNPDLATAEVLEPGKLVMEVKYTDFLPSLVRDLLPIDASEFAAVSKYVYCCDQTLFRQSEYAE